MPTAPVCAPLVSALLVARRAGVSLSWAEAALIDLDGGDLTAEVERRKADRGPAGGSA